MSAMTMLFLQFRRVFQTMRRTPATALMLGVAYVAAFAGTFTSTGSLATQRVGHTATLLPGGKVLVTGGSTAIPTNVWTATAELYDPTSGAWSATGSMVTARGYHTAALLPNGKVLVLGGTNGAVLNSAELYDPATGTFTATGSMGAARYLASTTLLPNGTVLVAGGSNSGYLSTCELYDPVAGTFSPTGSMVTARRQQVAILLANGKVLAAGGYNGTLHETALSEVYDSATGTWSATGSMASPRRAFAGALLPSGKVLVVNGYNGTASLSSCELFDPVAGAWSATGSTTYTRTYLTATLLTCGRVMVAGGSYGEVYDPATGTFATPIHTAASTRGAPTATLLPSGLLLLAAGDTSSTVLNSAELFDAQTAAAPGVVPSAAISAPAYVTANAGGYAASLPTQSGCTYTWAITGGVLTAGQGNAAATFTAGPSGAVGLVSLVQNIYGIPAQGSATSTVVPPPVADITAPAYVSTGATGLQASVAAQSGSSYAWTITGGTLSSPSNASSVTFTAGAAGTLTLQCIVTNPAGTATTGTRAVNVMALPNATISAPGTLSLGSIGAQASVPAQAASNYAWTITGGTILSGASQNAVYFTPSAIGTLSLQCAVANGAGASQTGNATVSIVQGPVITGFTASAGGITAGGSTTLTATFSGGTASIDHGVGAVTSGVGVMVSPTTSTTYTLTVTDAQGVSAKACITLSVLPAPVTTIAAADYVTASTAGLKASVPTQTGCTYLWMVTGGTATAGTTTSSVTYTAGASGTVTLSCKVTNLIGTFATGTKTQTIVPSPTITSFTAAQANITYGGSTTLTPTFSNGTGSVSFGVGAVTSGTTATVSPTVNTTYTLTVTNPAGKSVTATTRVNVYAAPNATISAASNVYASAVGATASVPSLTGATYVWTITGGTITAGATANVVTYTAAASGTVTLSVTTTNGAGATASGSKTLSIITPPTPSSAITVAAQVTTGQAGYTASVPAMTGATYAWTATGGTLTAGSSTRTVTFTPGAVGSLSLQCVVTNSLGVASTGNAVSNVIAAPVATITAPATVGAGVAGLTASVPAQSACTYAWTLTGGTFSSATNGNVVTFTAGTVGNLSLQCVVTNGAGSSVTGNQTVSVVAAQSLAITAPVAAVAGTLRLGASVPAQSGISYAWTITGGIITSSASGSDLEFSAPTAGNLVLQCTTVNTQGLSTTATTTIVVTGDMDISGVYATTPETNAIMTLYQSGTSVNGTWTGSEYGNGTFTGTVSGNVLNGAWVFPAVSGNLTLTFATDGRSTTAGSWGVNGSNTNWGPLSLSKKVDGSGNPLVSVQISPTSAVMQTNGVQPFVALVAGTPDKGLTWTSTGGAVSQAGMFTAPSVANLYKVTATSKVDPTQCAAATVAVSADGFMDVSGVYTTPQDSPSVITLYQSGTSITGTWTGSNYGDGTFTGTLNGNVLNGTWTLVSVGGALTVTFASDEMSTTSGSWGVNGSNSNWGPFGLVKKVDGSGAPIISVQTTPLTAVMQVGTAQAFSALVAGTPNKNVTWSIQEAGGGTITTTGGLYTAPAIPNMYHLDAVSVADATKKGTALVVVTPDGLLDVSGSYMENYGYTVILNQSGSQITGTVGGFEHLTGTLDNLGVLRGTWWHDDASQSGTFQWTFSFDATNFKFAGGYGLPGEAPLTHPWSGTRQAGVVTVQVTPSSTTLPPGWSQNILAAVSGSYDKTVNWSVSESGGGTVSSAGVYTAPSTLGTYHVVAASHASPTVTAQATVNVSMAGLKVGPDWVHVIGGNTQTFTAYIQGVPTSATWTVQGGSANGTITGTGGLYAAPTTPGQYLVVATSVVDPSQTASAIVVVDNQVPLAVTVTPGTIELAKGGTQTFIAAVAGSGNQAVTWSCSAGTITTAGLFTAPQHCGEYKVRATSVVDPSVYEEATITVSVTAGMDKSFTYDANGNMTGDGARTFEWDGENRLTAVNTLATGHRSEFIYDGLDRRIEIVEKDNSVVGSDTKYMWDGVEFAEARNSASSTVLKHFYSQGFVDIDGTSMYYTRDHLGSIREMVDTQQAVRARYDYDPYGRMTKVSGDRDSFFGYAGMPWHQVSGLNLAVFRSYDPNLGRWISRDPIEERGGKNLYGYVFNDPINKTDILGLCQYTFAEVEQCRLDFARRLNLTLEQARRVWQEAFEAHNRSVKMAMIIYGVAMVGCGAAALASFGIGGAICAAAATAALSAALLSAYNSLKSADVAYQNTTENAWFDYEQNIKSCKLCERCPSNLK